MLDIILPDGKIPDDLQWSYDPRPGLELSATFQLPPDLLQRSSTLTVFGIGDQTRVRVHAPTGFGILGDPTTLVVDAWMVGGGAVLEAMVAEGRWGDAAWSVSGGAGFIAYRGTTRMRVTSDFLDIDESETVDRIAPLASATLGISSAASPLSAALNVRLFPTDHFATAIASARIGVGF